MHLEEEFHIKILCQGYAEDLWQAGVPQDVIPLLRNSQSLLTHA